MKDEQIITELEHFHYRILHGYLAKKVFEQEIQAIIDAIGLIKRQKAQLVEQMLTVDAECDKCIAEARAEAIREFAERLDGYLTVNCTIEKNAVKSSIADDDIYFHGGKEIAFADVKQRIISILQELTEEQK